MCKNTYIIKLQRSHMKSCVLFMSLKGKTSTKKKKEIKKKQCKVHRNREKCQMSRAEISISSIFEL